MFKVGDKIQCVLEEKDVYVGLGEIVTVIELDELAFNLDTRVINDSGTLKQWVCSNRFKKVEE